MPKCKITVLKTLYNRDLAETYRRPDIHMGPCPYYSPGQEFLVHHVTEKPEDFPCGWAWDDIHKMVMTIMLGGNFGNWMADKHTMIACCTDGTKPVVFKLERVDD